MESNDMSENFSYLILTLAASFCAYRALISKHLLPSALYLACVSALVSITLYLLGAYEVAVIELSVGAGLVTVLLVYTLSVIGEDVYDPTSIIPKPLAILLVGVTAIIVGWMAYPLVAQPAGDSPVLLADVLWKRRALDVWVQVALIFSGVMGVLGLLSERVQGSEMQAVIQDEAVALDVKEEMHV
jgi:uncharacterized MnhB-related membrane protein